MVSSPPSNSSSRSFAPCSKTMTRRPSATSGASAAATVPPPAPLPMIATSQVMVVLISDPMRLVRRSLASCLPAARGGAVADAGRIDGLRVVAHEHERAQAPHATPQQNMPCALEVVQHGLALRARQVDEPPAVAQQRVDVEHTQEEDDLALRLAWTLCDCVLDDPL